MATLSCLFFFSVLAFGQTTFVKTGGTESGSFWATAAGDLQQVLAQAQTGDEIWVAAGVNKPITCVGCTNSQRDITFEISSGVKLFGGFNGNETALSQRSVTANFCTLSGDIDNDGQLDRNSYHVVKFDQVNAQTRTRWLHHFRWSCRWIWRT